MSKPNARQAITSPANIEVATAVQERIISLLNSRKNGSWNGTMTELNTAMTGRLRRQPALWPQSPAMLRRAINKVAASLRKSGVQIEFTRTNDADRKRIVSFRKN